MSFVDGFFVGLVFLAVFAAFVTTIAVSRCRTIARLRPAGPAAPAFSIDWRWVGYPALAIVAVAAIVAATYYGWSYIAPAVPEWLSTALGIRTPNLGAWIPDFGIWVFVLILAVVGAFALYYFGWISGRTLTGILLVLVAAVIGWFAPWGKLLPDKSPDLSALTEMPAWATILAPWLPAIAIVLALLVALYLFNAMGGRKLAGALVLLLAIALLPLAPWGSWVQQLTAWSAEGTCGGGPRLVTLGGEFEIINRGAHCHLDLKVAQGPVVLDDGKGHTQTIDDEAVFSHRFIKWKCASTQCIAKATFCPVGEDWSTEHKRCGKWERVSDPKKKILVRPTLRGA